MPKRKRGEELVCDGHVLHVTEALTPRDLQALESFLNSEAIQSSLQEAVLHDSSAAQYKSRKCESAWVELKHMPAARKLKSAVKAAQDHWDVLPRTKNGVLRCSYEDVQYAEYRGSSGSHFKQWHVDADHEGDDEEDKRMLTVVALLAQPNVDFEGGEFECMVPTYPNGEKHTLRWNKGDLIVFQARYLWHRVLPTTAGLRKTLVLWAKDPNTK